MAKVPVVPSLSASQIEGRARRILKEFKEFYPHIWKFGEPVPVDKIFELYVPEKLNIRIGYTQLQKLGVNAEGYTNARQRISLVDQSLSDDFSLRGSRRFRSTTGHEIGHCVLHVGLERWQQSLQIVGKGMKRERCDLKPYEDPEWQAWRFCQALCMPETLVRKALAKYGAGYHGVCMMMNQFDMNYSFVMARLTTLKVFPALAGNRSRGK